LTPIADGKKTPKLGASPEDNLTTTKRKPEISTPTELEGNKEPKRSASTAKLKLAPKLTPTVM